MRAAAHAPATLVLVLALALGLGGCSVARNELGQSGGALGALGDRTLPGVTKELQLYRATAAYALFSSIGSRLAADPDQILATLRYMVAVRNDIDMLAGHLWEGIGPDPRAPGGNARDRVLRPCARPPFTPACAGYRATFEADLPTLEGDLYKLAVIALPRDALRGVINDLVAQNWLGAARGLAQSGEDLFGAAHQAAATFRAEREILAQVLGLDRTEDGRPIDSVQAAAARLQTLDQDGKPDPEKWAALAGTVDQSSFDPLYWMVRQSCRRMLGRLTEKDLRTTLGIAAASSRAQSADAIKETVCDSFRLRPAPRT